MKKVTLTQATKQHNVNQLHDAFVAAGLVPLLVESDPGTLTSTFTFDDAITDPSIQSVITAYVFVVATIPPNWVQLGVNYRNAVTNSTTLAQAKAVLNGELWEIIKAFAKVYIKDL